MTPDPRLPPPVAAVRPHTSVWHGETLVDPYFWLRDQSYPTVDDPEVLAYVSAENAYFEAHMKPVDGLVTTILAELEGRMQQDDASVPVKNGAFEYWWRFDAGAQYRTWLRRPVGGGAEQEILSEPALAQGHDYFRLAGSSVSPDGRLLAYAVDTKGDERFVLRIRDLAAGTDVATVADNSIGVPVWAADSQALAWNETNDNWRSFRVRLHRLGSSAPDAVLYEETTDIGFNVGVQRSQDGRWFILQSRPITTLGRAAEAAASVASAALALRSSFVPNATPCAWRSCCTDFCVGSLGFA